MSNFTEKMTELVTLLARYTPQEGINWTTMPSVGAYRQSNPDDEQMAVYEPALLILGQGKKFCLLSTACV